MKLIYFSFLMALVIGATSFTTKPSPFIKEINSKFAKVKDNLFFSKFETSNQDYKRFLSHLQSNHPEHYEKHLLDPLQWDLDCGQAHPFIAYYHAHPAYDKYPVVAVRHESALTYCQWLTDQYNVDPSRNFNKVLFRLPTEIEWMYAASSGYNYRVYAWEGEQLINYKGEYLTNIRFPDLSKLTYDPITKAYYIVPDDQAKSVSYLAEVASYVSNEFGLYNMIGNAAEMLAEKGKAKGGSFNDVGYDVRIQQTKTYTGPSHEIGFRVVMEVVAF